MGLGMGVTTVEERHKIAQQVLGKDGEFPAYFNLYDDLAQRSNDFIVTIDRPSVSQPKTSNRILLVCNILKENAETTRAGVLDRITDAPGSSDPNGERAINMAVQAMFMADPAAKDWHSTDFVHGDYRPSSWLPNETLLDFVRRLFPIGLGNSQDTAKVVVEQKTLKARKLQKRLGARFRRTNNLAEHLLFDDRRNCLYIFHHVAFLKAQLERYQSESDPLTIGLKESLERGTLPPQLLVETLYSIQAVLFPSIDTNSAHILDELIKKKGFDPDCAQYEGYKLFREPSDGFSFKYWGERIVHLHSLLTRRPPRNKLERWFHQHSTEGNALCIALLALLISILVGVVSIVLNCVQLWVTWMAWKHPLTSPASS